MRIKIAAEWRIKQPKTDSTDNENERKVYNEFLKLIRRIASQGDPKFYFEHFKSYYCRSNGESYYPSSTVSWAESDLEYQMETSLSNLPIFIEAFYNACESLTKGNDGTYAPDVRLINQIMLDSNAGFLIEPSDPPELKFSGENPVIIDEPEQISSLSSRAMEILQNSMKRSDELLNEDKGREAVQESLWLLETMSTAFRGMETETGTVEGKYFNDIVKELRRSSNGRTLGRVLQWVQALHGYLSSPSGGAVRHGLDLNDGLDLNKGEARLFCNLIRSYMFYLLSEHDRLL